MLTNAAMTIALHDINSREKWAALPGRLARNALALAGEISKRRDIVYLIDVDGADCQATRELCDQIGYDVQTFSAVSTFLADHRPAERRCLLIDITRLRVQGFEFLERLTDEDDSLPCIAMSAAANCPMVVQAIRAGAFDFIEKPICRELFAESIERALNHSDQLSKTTTFQRTAAARIATLTRRQHEIMDLVIAGHPSKNIAADLGISQRTVENHRASICRKTGARNLSALIRTAIYGGCDPSFSGEEQRALA